MSDLRTAAQHTAEEAAAQIPETSQFFAAMVADPNVSSFDRGRCQAALFGLSSLVGASQGNLFVFAPSGALVCQLSDVEDALPLPEGDWFARLGAERSPVTSVTLHSQTGRPVTNMAIAIPSPQGIGVMVATFDARSYGGGIQAPKDMARGVELVELDATRTIVVAATPNAPVKPGRLPEGSWMRRSIGAETTRTDGDLTRYWQETSVRDLGHVVLAAIPESVAVAEATEELRTNLVVGVAVVALVVLLGVLLRRRIAKPIEALTEVIASAAETDHDLEAVPDGPREVAALARAFNKTMSERRQLERDLASALKDAQRSSKLKSEFLANMSHEIRTPMNGVLGMLSLLEDAKVSSEVRDCLHTMGESASSLMTILNELLDFSKLEAGMISTESVPFNVREAVQSAISPWVAIAGRQNVPLTARVDADVPESVLGDPTRVRQILANLIDNAVKFTSAGRITVAARRVNDDVVRFEVADTGIGISDEGRSHLFEPFVQADGTTTRRYGGTGLGLAICRQLVDVMGGCIGVDSTEGVGSTFWFQLPLPVASGKTRRRRAAAETSTPDVPPVAAQGRLLVVDDNAVNRKVAAQMLGKLGYSVELVGNGLEALEAIERSIFDAVLMDVQMPVMDGLEATTRLRRRGDRIPVVAMTASALDEDRTRCMQVGMDGYVVKPMNVESLGAELSRVLKLARAKATVATR